MGLLHPDTHGPLRPGDRECRDQSKDAQWGAEGLGFHPHRDYLTTKGIFGSIDPSGCPEEFKFGKNGKPFYISGPNETRADSERIVDILKKNLGPGRFDYMVQMDLKDQ